MTKSRDKPIAGASLRSRRPHKEWNVNTHILLQWDRRSDSARQRIVSAALFGNVTARICGGLACASPTKYAIRLVMTRVLPDPAPARIRRGPLIRRTASRCSGLRAERKFIDSLVVPGAWWVPRAWWVLFNQHSQPFTYRLGSEAHHYQAPPGTRYPPGTRHEAPGTPILQSRTSLDCEADRRRSRGGPQYRTLTVEAATPEQSE